MEPTSEETENTTGLEQICAYNGTDANPRWGNFTFPNLNNTLNPRRNAPIYGYWYDANCLNAVIGFQMGLLFLNIMGYVSYLSHARNQALQYNSRLKNGSGDSSTQCLEELEKATGTPWIRRAVRATLKKVYDRTRLSDCSKKQTRGEEDLKVA